MAEWWTYSLRDLLLFSPQTYYRLFELYNIELWPLHIFALALGVAILLLWRQNSDNQGRASAAILALCWLWVAWAYFWQRYSSINWAANYYAFAFTLEALLLLWAGVVRGQLAFTQTSSLRRRTGQILFVLALIFFPMIGPLLGRNWTQAEIFGMSPDPTALATLAILLLCSGRPVKWLLPIPAAWCLISGATLWTMGSPDFVLAPFCTLLVISLMTRTDNNRK